MLGGGRVERVEHAENTIEVFENDIDLYLHQFQDEQNIEDLRTVPQSVWNACLMYIQRHVFNNKAILKAPNIYNSNSIMDSNYNMYNYDLVNDILDYYIYIYVIYIIKKYL
jgi:phosphate starvation-inducible membrane PsiE